MGISVKDRQMEWERLCAEESELLLKKGADYTAGQAEENAYANFEIIADLLKGAKITPFTVALIYFLKHVLSIITFAKTGEQESGEPLRGRFMDIRNYAFILSQLAEQEIKVDISVWGGTLSSNGDFTLTPEGYLIRKEVEDRLRNQIKEAREDFIKAMTTETVNSELRDLKDQTHPGFDPDDYVPIDVLPQNHQL